MKEKPAPVEDDLKKLNLDDKPKDKPADEKESGQEAPRPAESNNLNQLKISSN